MLTGKTIEETSENDDDNQRNKLKEEIVDEKMKVI
jgi:hypothetical protein